MGDNIPIDAEQARTDRDYDHYGFPEEMEALPYDHEFYIELCELIEKYEENETERERFLIATLEFGEIWLSNLHTTGGTW